MSGFLRENHRDGPALILLNALRVLSVLSMLNVLNMPMDASLACWAMFLFVSLPLCEPACACVLVSIRTRVFILSHSLLHASLNLAFALASTITSTLTSFLTFTLISTLAFTLA